jgi:hypothetical protein
MKSGAGIFWRAQTDAQSWAKVCSSGLHETLGLVFGNEFNVELRMPTADEVAQALKFNQSIIGNLSLKRKQSPEAALRFQTPIPYHGVFIKGSEESPDPGFLVWASWLGERPGFRFFKPNGGPRRETVHWRVGLPNGRYVQCPCADLKNGQHDKIFPDTARLLPPQSSFPKFLHELHEQTGSIAFPQKRRRKNEVSKSFWKELHRIACEALEAGKILVTDEDDLNHRSLVTYPAWLKGRLAEVLVDSLLRAPAGDAALVVRALKERTSLDSESQDRLWNWLTQNAQSISMRLSPPGWDHDGVAEGEKRFCPLQRVKPLNPADMAALLTQVRRYPLAHDVQEMLPGHYRQNHPSFRGRICPVQSPESGVVGLSLHLAKGATVDWDGRIHPASGDEPSEELGFGAGLVQFYEHNDGARCMMGAKNLRQAVPVAKRQQPVVRSGGEKAVREFVHPLIECGMCPDAIDDKGNPALGTDLLVAYLPWNGMNVDDAIVVGNHVVENGLLDIQITKRIRRRLNPGWIPTSLGRASIITEELGGLAVPGDTLLGGSLIAAFGLEGYQDRVKWELRYLDRSPAKLRSIGFRRGAPWMGGVLEYELAKELKLGMGDKLMGRHGNKGVVGAVLPADQMPRLPDNPAMPAHLRGRPIDVLLNPHGVISRMNLGQLLETHVGWLLRAGFKQEELLRDSLPARKDLGQAFARALDHSKVQKLLERSGLDRFGRVQLVMPDGSLTRSPVVVGFQHIVRLRHVPELKSQTRRGGKGALYSRSTGQAVHGRALGGGQRAGEMEVWALAAHQAEHVLEELLGVKADSILTQRFLEKTKPASDRKPEGFEARLRDWLFALLIDLKFDGRKATLKFLNSRAVAERVGTEKKLKTSAGLTEKVRATFCCQSRRKGGDCPFVLLDGARIAATPPEGEGRQPTLQLADLLTHLGFEIELPLQRADDGFSLRLKSNHDGQATGKLKVCFSPDETNQVKAEIFPDAKHAPAGWPAALEKINAYVQFQLEKGRNVEAKQVIEEFQKEEGRFSIGQMRVSCPTHTTVPLKGKPPFSLVHNPIPGGLFDSQLFGPVQSAGTTDDSKHWAYIELPAEIPFPIEAFLGRNEDGDEFLKKHGISKRKLPPVRYVPVLPLRYRMPLLFTGTPMQDDFAAAYGEILDACRASRLTAANGAPAKATEKISANVTRLFRFIIDRLTGKEGLIRHDGLGRRVDRSARLVIVPNPDLRWDQAGVPTAVLLELLGDELAKWMQEKRASGDLVEMLDIMLADQCRSGPLEEWSWQRSNKDSEVLQHGYQLLRRFLDAHPDVLVILNRQPSLHRDSIQSFHPVPLPPESGDVIQLCPLVCKGFGADFDGDEMAVHVPVSAKAREDARKLLPSQNMFSLATGEVLAQYDQDFVLGLYWLSRDESGFKDKLLEILPEGCCRELVTKKAMDKSAGNALLEHISKAHPHQAPEIIWKLSKLAFNCCSRMGVSFGFYELVEMAKRCSKEARRVADDFDKSKPGAINAELQKVVEKPLREILDGKADFNQAGLHFSAMALSGARGRSQVRQLLAARGFLNPGGLSFKAPIDDFLICSSLTKGMSPDEAFFAAMNARSSMCDKKLGTRQSGYLTRRLVTALWPVHITENNCGSKRRPHGPATCLAKSGVCAECYGLLPDGSKPIVGFPAGLIAAQSIGERGTQLSMQSFHTGEKVFSIQNVLAILDGKESEGCFEGEKDAKSFIEAMKVSDAYRKLENRHFEILWRVISRSPGKSLKSAIQSSGLITRIAFENQAKQILLGASNSNSGSLDEPVSRVLFNRFGTQFVHAPGGQP